MTNTKRLAEIEAMNDRGTIRKGHIYELIGAVTAAEARLTRLVDGLNNILLIYQWDAAQTAAIQALIKEARSGD